MNKRNKISIAVALGLMTSPAFAATVSVSAPFVDSGYYNHRILDASGATHASIHFVSGNGSGDKQFGLTGTQNGRLFGFDFTNQLRSYKVFDLSGVTEEVLSATFRIWAWAENGNEIVAGVYRSDDASETVSLFSVDNHSAADVRFAPFDDALNHTVDIPIWNDLGDGDIYATRIFTQADEENPGLMPSPVATITTDCSNPSPGQACGRWIDIDLTAALTDINSATGDWIFGLAVTSIDGGPPGNAEQVFSGNVVDLSLEHLQEFRTPAPQLNLTVVPVPAAVWLFGSGLLGLVAIARRRRSKNLI